MPARCIEYYYLLTKSFRGVQGFCKGVVVTRATPCDKASRPPMNYGLFGQSAADELRPFLAASHGIDYEQFRGWRAQSAAGWIASCSGGATTRQLWPFCAVGRGMDCELLRGWRPTHELRPFQAVRRGWIAELLRGWQPRATAFSGSRPQDGLRRCFGGGGWAYTTSLSGSRLCD